MSAKFFLWINATLFGASLGAIIAGPALADPLRPSEAFGEQLFRPAPPIDLLLESPPRHPPGSGATLLVESDAAAQVTSVSQLSDVQPLDWAFQALQSLVERYGCIAGYPDGSFRGNRAATRFELAAALNACLDSLDARFATQEDLATLKALQDEFATELATLRGRVDALEARTKTLEAQQFSTTTKLTGEIIFAVSGIAGDTADANPATEIDANLTFTQRTRLALITSFTGRDRLFTRLQSSNRPINFGTVSGTPTTRLAFDTGNNNNEVILDRLDYKFPIGKQAEITIFANAAFHQFYATTVNPFFESFGGAKGAISWFGERNPIYRIGTVGLPSTAGVGATYRFKNPAIRIDAGYLAPRSNLAVGIPTANGFTDGGLFGGTYSALAQVSYKPSKSTEFALTYIRNFAPDGDLRHGAGSTFANVPFVEAGVARPLTSNSVGVEASIKVLPRLFVGGWFGYTAAERADNSDDSADIINYAINFALPDLGRKGALGGLIFGVPPRVINNTLGDREDPGTTYHLEALYQFPINKNIAITPAVIYLINPNQNDANNGIVIGVVRTTFTF